MLIADSTKPAARYTVESIRRSPRPGARSRRAASTPLVTSRVFASGNFSTTITSPLAVADDAVADEQLVILDDPRDVAEPQSRLPFDGDLTERLRVDDRGNVLHGEPLVGRVDEPAGARGRGLQEAQGRGPGRVAGGR